MKFYHFLSMAILMTTPGSFADSLYCNLVEKPETSSMKIDYADNLPVSIFLQSPGSDDFRELSVEITPVFPRNERNEESFVAKPILKQSINWGEEPNCFKEIGTQWYFEFRHNIKRYTVQFTPYFTTSHKTCFLPRFQPQTNILDCNK